ncbi:hypothetical protein NE237_032198 [Protea cynaroides]|uniref:Uncharacterized protein n=1 Tax=Protea cynaroides TaxID=273540 RepID=A0A9Q0L3K2_9MAGN|nr:hypothetical protein NE237_032198 [Protea cynaroides]
MTPRMKEVDRLNVALTDHRRSDIERLKSELEKGREFARKCSSDPSWNIFRGVDIRRKSIRINFYYGAFKLRFSYQGQRARIEYAFDGIEDDIVYLSGDRGLEEAENGSSPYSDKCISIGQGFMGKDPMLQWDQLMYDVTYWPSEILAILLSQEHYMLVFHST